MAEVNNEMNQEQYMELAEEYPNIPIGPQKTISQYYVELKTLDEKIEKYEEEKEKHEKNRWLVDLKYFLKGDK